MTPGRYTCFISNNAGYLRLSLSLRSYFLATLFFGCSTIFFGIPESTPGRIRPIIRHQLWIMLVGDTHR
jgi:hypothetical protein